MRFETVHPPGRNIVLGTLLVCLCLVSPPLGAADVILTNPKKSSDDHRFDYTVQLLQKAMMRTEHRYGPVRVQQYVASTSRNRALRKLVAGDLHVFSAPTRTEWENSTIPIRIPLRRGLLGYRLMLIRDGDQDMFAGIRTVDQLKKLSMISGAQWSTTLAFRRLGFNIEGGTNYEPLFSMLMRKRGDYFPRGINEIFKEVELRQAKFPAMRIERSMALYLPLPTYFFVSPKRPELAKRLEEGLLSLIEDGTLNALFERFHRDSIAAARLHERRIFRFRNLNLPAETPLARQDFWFDPNS